MENAPEFALSCPIPIQRTPTVQMAHGGGGKLMHQLVEKMFFNAFANESLAAVRRGL